MTCEVDTKEKVQEDTRMQADMVGCRGLQDDQRRSTKKALESDQSDPWDLDKYRSNYRYQE